MQTSSVGAAVASATLLAVLLAGLPAAQAAPREIRRSGATGLGVGSATLAQGISGKHFLSDRLAVQGVAGSLGNYRSYCGVALAADAVHAMPLLFEGQVDLGWNVGAGAGFAGCSGKTVAAFSALAGLEVLFKEAPVDLVVEIRPVAIAGGALHVLSDIDGFTAHMRYYFR